MNATMEIEKGRTESWHLPEVAMLPFHQPALYKSSHRCVSQEGRNR